MELISYCCVSCVTSAVEKSSFLGSSFNFSGTTSSDVRHTASFPASEIKSSVRSTVQREALLDCTSRGGVKGHLESPVASFNVVYTVKSEEQGERSERICGSNPTVCFLHKCTIVPTHMVRSSVCFKDCIAPVFHRFKQDTSEKGEKSGLRSSVHKAITEPMCVCRARLVVHAVSGRYTLIRLAFR